MLKFIKKHEYIFSFTLLGFLMLAFFRKEIFLEGIFCDGDLWMLYYPDMTYAASLIRKGILPLWTPKIFMGFPLLAEGSAGVLYPGNFLFLLLPGYAALNYTLILHSFLAGIFMYLYARKIEICIAGAIISAISFMFSGFVIAQIMHVNLVNTMPWLPLILYFIERFSRSKQKQGSEAKIHASLNTNANELLSLRTPKLRGYFRIIRIGNRKWANLLLAGLFLGIQFLAGYFFLAILTFILSLVYLAYRILTTSDSTASWLFRLKNTIVAALILGSISVGISAVQLLPNYELAQLSVRSGGISFDTSTQVSLPPLNLITLISPHILGHPKDGTYWSLWQANYIDLVVYIGILPVILAGFAVWTVRQRAQGAVATFYTITCVIAFLLAFGQFSPLWWIVHLLPGFRMMRVPSRFIFLSTFSMAVLAGIGFDRLSTITNAQIRKSGVLTVRRYTKGVFIFSLFFILAVACARPLAISNKDALLKFGGFIVRTYVHGKSVHTASLEEYYKKSELLYNRMLAAIDVRSPNVFIPLLFLIASVTLLFLWQIDRIPRIALTICCILVIFLDLFIFSAKYNGLAAPAFYKRKTYYVQELENDKTLFRYSFYPLWISMRNFDSMVGGISYLQGYSPLQLNRHAILMRALREQMRGIDKGSGQPLLNLLNVKYLITDKKLDQEGLETIFDEGAKIYKNRQMLPRTFIVPHAQLVRGENEALQQISALDFEPTNIVYLETAKLKKSSIKKSDSPAPGENWNWNAEIVDYQPNQIKIKAELSHDGFLVLTDTYYPGWKAYVDGKSQPVFRANYYFRAIQLPKGKHDVRFAYQPLSFRLGMLISLTTLLLLVIAYWLLVIRKTYRSTNHQ